ncbi:MAG: polyphosphate:AMP phosphotransferase [Candidatus Dactylopiibacterium sp.]|nr:polyphosphate:AMP phosphotransferase [Candidatus Dactylopiibacterium sp.]
MFESAEAGHRVDKERFRREERELRAELLMAQNTLLRSEKPFQVLLLVSGVDGAGKSETIAQLHEWMDPRFLLTCAFEAGRNPAEAGRPPMWRYWQSLPPRGRIGIFAGSWYSRPIARRLAGKLARTALDARLEEINRFEAMLVNEGALVLKLWFHLSRKGQAVRLRRLERDPRTAWRVTRETWARTRSYNALQKVAAHVLRVTNTAAAPWTIVDGSDDNYRNLCVGRLLLDALRERLAAPPAPAVVAPVPRPAIDARNVLSALDLGCRLDDRAYARELPRWQGRLAELVRRRAFAGRSLILAFEGMDAAGKGGAIRRVTAALDPRNFRVVPIAAPTDEESAQPYLWRFWRHIPGAGRVAIFDRSWYGRVLVERIEGFCSEADWLRAYAEINDFEHELVAAGAVVLKFWLQIDPDEQLRRFEAREAESYKRFKITPDDWRNRDKWSAYQQAAVDMIDRTSTGRAPWIPVEANDKNFARVKILKAVCKHLEDALDKD